MPSVLNVDTIVAANGTDPVALTKQFAAKAWLKYAGSGTTFDDSEGVSSATDNGTGDYTYSLTSTMSNANYAICATAANTSSGGAVVSACPANDEQTTSAFNVEHGYTSGGGSILNFDSVSYVSIFGDLA